MTDDNDSSQASSNTGIDEAERMAKIRELLIGPALADESARMETSLSRLDQLANDQREMMAIFERRLDELERGRRNDTEYLKLRLLGLVETLLADDDELRARLMRNQVLRSRLHDNEVQDAE